LRSQIALRVNAVSSEKSELPGSGGLENSREADEESELVSDLLYPRPSKEHCQLTTGFEMARHRFYGRGDSERFRKTE
jgi:hypothetical protein